MHSSLRALKLHGLIKVDAKWERNKNQQNVYQKTQTNEQCLFNFTVSVEFSCKYVSDNIFFKKKNLYNIVECEGFLNPRHRLLKSCIRLCLHQAVNLCLYHIELLVSWEEAPHLNDISLRTTFVGLCVSLDTFSTTVGDK